MRSGRALIAALCLLPAATALAADDVDAVRGAFSAYRSAILSGEGDAAAALLSRSTYDYYDEMRRLALEGSPEAVQAQSLVNQMQVLLLRLRVPREKLESLSAEALVAHTVYQGWVAKSSVLRLEPGKVVPEGDAAVLHVIIDEQDAGPAFHFQREAGSWRLDLVPTTQASNDTLELAAQQQGVPRSEFMRALMESAVGRPLGPEIWAPLRSAARP